MGSRSPARAELALLVAALAAALLTFQAWGLAAAAAVAAVVGLVGIRRGLTPPIALAAATAAGAGFVHFAVAPEHFAEWWGFGLFFVVCGEVQVGWALLLGRRCSWLLLSTGLAGSLLLVGLWAASRTTGLPFGPQPGTPEPVGIPDLIAVGLELVTAVACAWALLAPTRVLAPHPAATRILSLAAVAAVTAWALVAVGPA